MQRDPCIAELGQGSQRSGLRLRTLRTESSPLSLVLKAVDDHNRPEPASERPRK